MEKLLDTNNYIQKSRISKLKLRKICYLFSQDYTASQTALKIKVSRNTINSYYKILRSLLLKQEDLKIDEFLKNNEYSNESLNIKYIKPSNKNCQELIYFIEFKKRVFILDKEKKSFNRIKDFLKIDEQENIFNKRINCIKVLFNQNSNKYLILKHLHTANDLNEFTKNRLKRFRGLNKNNIFEHVKESQIRFSSNNTYVYNTLVKYFIT